MVLGAGAKIQRESNCRTIVIDLYHDFQYTELYNTLKTSLFWNLR